MRVGIFGRGRLGAALREALPGAPDLDLAWHVDQGESPSCPVEVAIDASVGSAVEGHLEWALETGTDLVIGATGWELPDLEHRIGARIGVLVAPNFSLTVAFMARLSRILGRYAELDAGLDPYLVEHHHRLKRDAPSGTARRLAEAVLEGCPRKTGWTLEVPEIPQLHISVLRAGSEVGDHTVGLDGALERLELRHRAHSRTLFGQGALRCAAWLHGRKGLHTFDSFASHQLDPLFHGA